ncbi:MAG: phosphatidate cytidylyltransferase [Burkholderiaceae bacterium]
MLHQRIATAIVLLAILLPTIFWWPAWTWAVLTLVFLTVAAREWGDLLAARQRPAAGAGERAAVPPASRAGLLAALGVGAIGVALLAWRQLAGWPPAFGTTLSALAVLWWCTAAPLRLAGRGAGRTRPDRHNPGLGGPLSAGLLLLACWVALIELHARGPLVLLAAMAIVWIADIAAYFVGRALGRRKLAPTISPGKSWEGALGGALAVVLAGALVWLLAADGGRLAATLPAQLFEHATPWLAVPVLLALTALSIVGDLHESLLKRAAGVKDSGRLLPGHGGVLDRIDALLPVMPSAWLLHRLIG